MLPHSGHRQRQPSRFLDIVDDGKGSGTRVALGLKAEGEEGLDTYFGLNIFDLHEQRC